MNKKIISLLLSLITALTISLPFNTKGAEPSKDIDKVKTIEKLNGLSDGKLKLSEKDGQVFLAGKLSTNLNPGENSALKFLQDNKAIFGLDNVTNELKIIDIKKDELGHTYVKLQQLINGLEVDGSSINLNFDKNGVIVSVNGNLEKDKSITTLGNKAISESDAVSIAEKQFTYKSLRNTPKAEKLILTKDNKNYEVYKVNIFYMEPTIENYDVYVEAHTGQVIETESNLRYDGPVNGSGIDVNGVQRNLNLYQSGTSYLMRDTTNPASSDIDTYSLNHSTTSGTIVSNSTTTFNSEDYKASVSAHYNAEQVINFYKNLFNRNSLDNNGMDINSFTHYSNNYDNAFWDGNEMIYGDGDGTTFTYLSGDLGIVGHEMTHGVISNTANLSYHNQSGALNESIADVFGVLIKTYNKYNVANGGSWAFNPADWVIGDIVYTPNIPGDALRSLANPTLDGQPDNMSDYKKYPDTTSGDNGGVHINSGITNKAAYNIASLIGMEKTAKIYYRALTNYMSTNTDFAGAKNCLMQAAADLYGQNSVEVTDINTAFNNVGINDPSTIHVTGISLNKTSVVLKPYSQETLSVNFQPFDAADKNITWTSSSPDVASVSGGVVNALKPGTTIVTATSEDGGYTAACTVNVDNGVSSVAITGANIPEGTNTQGKVKVGESIILNAIVSPSGTLFDKSVLWSSDNSEVAQVDSNGKVTGLTRGTATITAKSVSSDNAAYCTITVYEDSNITYRRIGGKDRFETATQVSKAGWTASDNVVLTNAFGFADALTGVPFAYIKDAPILLTSANVLSDTTYNEIVRLNARNIYILGGTGVVGENIEDALRAKGYNVIRIFGLNRFETAIAIGNEVIKANNTDTAILTTAYDYPDALAIGPYAARKKYPVLYTDNNTLTPSTKDFLKRNGIKNIIIPDGEGVISRAVANELISSGFSVDRVSGLNRYQTALKIVNKFSASFGYDIMLASGEDFPDGLSGGVLAAKKGIPILLVGNNTIDPDVANYIRGNGRITMYLLGGTGVMPDNIMSR